MISVLTIWQILEKEKSRKEQKTWDVLDGILVTVHQMLLNGGGKQFDDPDLRITVHALRQGKWKQITDYAGPSVPSGKGREMNMRLGVLGGAIRTGQIAKGKLPPGEDFLTYLVKQFGYAREEAASLKPDRQSWVAVPIGEPGNVVAVLYCDSKERDFFGANGKFRMKVLESAAIGIAQFHGYNSVG